MRRKEIEDDVEEGVESIMKMLGVFGTLMGMSLFMCGLVFLVVEHYTGGIALIFASILVLLTCIHLYGTAHDAEVWEL
jgi:4-hydroxybenzoate polyprenyltransferase